MTNVTLDELENIEKGFFVIGSKFIKANTISSLNLTKRLFEENYLTTVLIQCTGGGKEIFENEDAIEFLEKYKQYLSSI